MHFSRLIHFRKIEAVTFDGLRPKDRTIRWDEKILSLSLRVGGIRLKVFPRTVHKGGRRRDPQ
jgi:hypothetical protein